jgi:hypothetical protein
MNGIAAHFIREQTGVLLVPFALDLAFFYVFGAIIFLGLMSGLPPAISAYRVDISPKSQAICIKISESQKRALQKSINYKNLRESQRKLI